MGNDWRASPLTQSRKTAFLSGRSDEKSCQPASHGIIEYGCMGAARYLGNLRRLKE